MAFRRLRCRWGGARSRHAALRRRRHLAGRRRHPSRTAKVEALAALPARAAHDGPTSSRSSPPTSSGVLPPAAHRASAGAALQGLPEPAGELDPDRRARSTPRFDAIAAIAGAGSRRRPCRRGRATCSAGRPADEQAWLRGLITGETAPGRARRADAPGRRQGGRRARRRGAPGRHARRLRGPGRARGPDRRRRGARRADPRGRPAAAPDARRSARPTSRRPWPRCGGEVVGRRPSSTASGCRCTSTTARAPARAPLHPHARRDHRRGCPRSPRRSRRLAVETPRARRRGHRARRGWPAAALPGDRRAHGEQRRRRPAARGGAADAVLLRRAAPRRRRPPRRAGPTCAGTRLARTVPPAWLVPRERTDDPARGPAVLRRPRRRRPRGRRRQGPRRCRTPPAGAVPAWVKVKPRHTLDLVVLAVEWGSGRRKGWLSNIHLGARDADDRRLRDARQDVQGDDRRDARLADRALPGARPSTAPATGS